MNKFNLDEVAAKMETVKVELPILLANQAQRHFVASWQEQGYEGAQWKEVKRRIAGTKEYKYPKYKGLSRRTLPILVRSGALRRDVNNRTGGFIRSKTWSLVRLVSDTKDAKTGLMYSSFVNEKRTFMADSPGLRMKQEKLITETLGKAFPR